MWCPQSLAGLTRSLHGVPPSLWVIYVSVAMYALCYQMQGPVLPYLVKSLGADANGYGRMMTAFGVVQFFGGLAAGPLADTLGGEVLLLLSFGASALCYLLTAGASAMWMLYASRLPTVMQHAVLAARTVVTESTAEADRARMLGYVGLAYGVGFLVGPGLGGMVSSGHLQNSAWLATLGSLVSMAMVLRYLPASRTLAPRPPPKADGGGMDDGSGRPTATRPVSRFDLREMHRVCTIKGVPSLLAVKLLSGLGSGLFHAIFALVAEERFQLTPGETGLVMSFVGGLTMLSQAFLIEYATLRFSDRAIVEACVAVLTGGFLLLAAVTHSAGLCMMMVPLVPAGCLLATVNTSQLTKAAPKDSGTIIAVDMSLGSLVHILTPTISTYILTTAGYPYVLLASASLPALLLALIRGGLVDT